MTTWAGTEPIEPDAHPDCECPRCLPTCAIDGCGSFEVTATSIPIAGGRTTVLLCEQHRLAVSQPRPGIVLNRPVYLAWWSRHDRQVIGLEWWVPQSFHEAATAALAAPFAGCPSWEDTTQLLDFAGAYAGWAGPDGVWIHRGDQLEYPDHPGDAYMAAVRREWWPNEERER